MGARDLLTRLSDMGVTVTADGDRLLIRPASKLTDDLRAELRAVKPGLLALLAEPDALATESRKDQASTGAAARLDARRARLIRWGWPEPEAQAMAALLARRDLNGDERMTCTECASYRPGRCANHRRAGLHTAELGRDLAALLQGCPGYTA